MLLTNIKRRLRLRFRKMPPVKPGDTVLLGDSMLSLAPGLPEKLSAALGGGPVTSAGRTPYRSVVSWAISGLNTRDVMVLAKRLRNPGVVIISAGINDVQQGAYPEDIIGRRYQLAALFTRSILLPLIPVHPELYEQRIRPRNRPGLIRPTPEVVRHINDGLPPDCYPDVVRDGALRTDCTTDGLHLNTELGAALLAEAVLGAMERRTNATY